MEVLPGDLEELQHQILQPQRLVQGDARVLGTLLHRQVGVVLQQGQVADHRGQGRFQIVRQKDQQIVFALFLLPGALLAQAQSGLQAGQVALQGRKLPGQLHRLAGLVGHLMDGVADAVEPAGEHAHGEPEGHQHDDHDGRAHVNVLHLLHVSAVQLQRRVPAVAEQHLHHPDEASGEGILPQAVHQIAQHQRAQKQRRQRGRQHPEDQGQLQPGVFILFHGRPSFFGSGKGGRG